MTARFRGVGWGMIAALALWWPARLLSPLDGIPLDGRLEALALGLAFPILWWLHPAFLKRWWVRGLVLTLLTWKLGASLLLTQGGWCGTFVTQTPLVDGGSRRQQSWDLRTGWPFTAPACSAILTRPYAWLYDFPAWFTNVTIDEARRPPNAPFTLEVSGFFSTDRSGMLSFAAGTQTQLSGSIDDLPLPASEMGGPAFALERGVHRVDLEVVFTTASSWHFTPLWNGQPLWDAILTTVHPPSVLDRAIGQPARWITPLLVALLLLWWAGAAVRALDPNPSMVWWTLASSLTLAAIGWDPTPWSLSERMDRFAPLLLLGCLVLPVGRRLQNLRGAFVLLGIPWLSFLAARSFAQIGQFTLFSIGDDWLTFQRYAHRIFMEGYWLEGGEKTFWYQPLYRWINGVLHLVFGDSSVGEVYWDAIGLLIGALFSFHVARVFAGFRFGLLAGATTLATYTLGPIWFLIGRGLSEISAAAWAYLAGFSLLRARLGSWSWACLAGLFGVLAFYTRLNQLLFAAAMVALVLPLTRPAARWPHGRALLHGVSWKVPLLYGACLAIGVLLFAWRTWYFTGVFSLFQGTQHDYVSIGLGPSTLFSPAVWGKALQSLLMVVTVHDPPRPNPFEDPRGFLVMCGAIVAFLALLGVPGLRRLPLGPAVVCLGGVAFSLLVRGASYPGRFSVHLVPAAIAMSICVMAMVWTVLVRRG